MVPAGVEIALTCESYSTLYEKFVTLANGFPDLGGLKSLAEDGGSGAALSEEGAVHHHECLRTLEGFGFRKWREKPRSVAETFTYVFDLLTAAFP